ncbi:MAG: cyclically-permuted mutarotase family protein [Bacteroidaceae bacterium]|nr:cyclically-permuted mutarotase family protein [Bacteroidaceae bacterium]
MKLSKYFPVVLPLIVILLSVSCNRQPSFVKAMGFTPDDDTCYAKGVSGAYLGIVDGQIILAGGANFPGEPASTGGKKAYYDAVYAASAPSEEMLSKKGGLRRAGLHWRRAAVLPAPLAYGVAVSDSTGMYFVGGMNDEGSYGDAFRLYRDGHVLRLQALPSLPYDMDNMGGAMLDKWIYVVGGNRNGQPSSEMYSLDAAKSEWFACAPVPGAPRLQPVCAAANGYVYVWGGYCPASDSTAAFVHTDGWKYDLKTDSWTSVAAPVDETGAAVTLTGGCAAALPDGSVLAAGGVDKDIFLAAIRGEYPSPEYLMHEPKWYRFNAAVYRFDPSTEEWSIVGQSARTARAGASFLSLSSSGALLVGGETKPGIRSKDITLIQF